MQKYLEILWHMQALNLTLRLFSSWVCVILLVHGSGIVYVGGIVCSMKHSEMYTSGKHFIKEQHPQPQQ